MEGKTQRDGMRAKPFLVQTPTYEAMGTDWDGKDHWLQDKYLWGLIECKEEGIQRT